MPVPTMQEELPPLHKESYQVLAYRNDKASSFVGAFSSLAGAVTAAKQDMAKGMEPYQLYTCPPIIVGQGATQDAQQHGAGLMLDSTSTSEKHVLWKRSGSGAAVDGTTATGADAAEWELLGGDLVLTRQLSGKHSVALRLKSGTQGTELDIVSISYDVHGNRTGEKVLANFAPQP